MTTTLSVSAFSVSESFDTLVDSPVSGRGPSGTGVASHPAAIVASPSCIALYLSLLDVSVLMSPTGTGFVGSTGSDTACSV